MYLREKVSAALLGNCTNFSDVIVNPLDSVVLKSNLGLMALEPGLVKALPLQPTLQLHRRRLG